MKYDKNGFIKSGVLPAFKGIKRKWRKAFRDRNEVVEAVAELLTLRGGGNIPDSINIELVEAEEAEVAPPPQPKEKKRRTSRSKSTPKTSNTEAPKKRKRKRTSTDKDANKKPKKPRTSKKSSRSSTSTTTTTTTTTTTSTSTQISDSQQFQPPQVTPTIQVPLEEPHLPAQAPTLLNISTGGFLSAMTTPGPAGSSMNLSTPSPQMPLVSPNVSMFPSPQIPLVSPSLHVETTPAPSPSPSALMLSGNQQVGISTSSTSVPVTPQPAAQDQELLNLISQETKLVAELDNIKKTVEQRKAKLSTISNPVVKGRFEKTLQTIIDGLKVKEDALLVVRNEIEMKKAQT
eukprot:TRINITY_DN1996_c0_g2_i2.p1 TRINITY_DN1996_c0_g2~~TRINITY_DN1996_c0_g2_i2.p1  ORF type:complete len:346 (+),score=88.49 TRINITY_DN1996_c0_g2_i2:396-1433(+)